MNFTTFVFVINLLMLRTYLNIIVEVLVVFFDWLENFLVGNNVLKRSKHSWDNTKSNNYILCRKQILKLIVNIYKQMAKGITVAVTLYGSDMGAKKMIFTSLTYKRL